MNIRRVLEDQFEIAYAEAANKFRRLSRVARYGKLPMYGAWAASGAVLAGVAPGNLLSTMAVLGGTALLTAAVHDAGRVARELSDAHPDDPNFSEPEPEPLRIRVARLARGLKSAVDGSPDPGEIEAKQKGKRRSNMNSEQNFKTPMELRDHAYSIKAGNVSAASIDLNEMDGNGDLLAHHLCAIGALGPEFPGWSLRRDPEMPGYGSGIMIPNELRPLGQRMLKHFGSDFPYTAAHLGACLGNLPGEWNDWDRDAINGVTLLHAAAAGGHVPLLVQGRHDLFLKRDDRGMSPFMIFAHESALDIVQSVASEFVEENPDARRLLAHMAMLCTDKDLDEFETQCDEVGKMFKEKYGTDGAWWAIVHTVYTENADLIRHYAHEMSAEDDIGNAHAAPAGNREYAQTLRR